MNSLWIFLLLLISTSLAKSTKRVLDDDNFLQLLEVEIARTLRSELSSDDELQNLEGSGEESGESDDGYLKKTDPTLTPIFPTPESFTSTTTETTTTSTTTTTTTVAPSTTTTTAVKQTTKKPAQGPPQCVANKDCFSDSECPSGKCLGSELGVCDCNACITNRKCEGDVDCGGLRNSCDSNGYCDCVKAFHSHGYELFVKVLLTFCHQRKCTPDTDNCYGLPCRVGKCKCAPAAKSTLPVHYFKPGGK